MSSLRTARYARAWLGGAAPVVEEEVTLDRAGTAIHATLLRPRGASSALPAWVVLHGVTRRGRAHEQLARFTRALASTGAVVVVPEVPEWRALDLAPRLAVPTVRAAIDGVRTSGWARAEPVGLIGFSFGAPHAIAATGHPDVRDDVAGSVGFGAYCSLASTVRFLMTGWHEWEGRRHRTTPDPYGRWIVGANYLDRVPDHRDAGDVAAALRALAAEAGDLGIASADPRLDARKRTLAGHVAPERRWIFELFAPAGGTLPPQRDATDLAEALVAAATRTDPTIEPLRALASVTRSVHVLHARHDDLIPFSEALRLRAALPATTRSRVTVTRLFGHAGESPLSPGAALRELPGFLVALRSVLRVV